MAEPATPAPPSTATHDGGGAISPRRPPLHTVLPPLILGTATFNTQFVADPHSMPYRDIVARALALGVNAFDTSPYYGPSEILLGTALGALMKNPTPSIDASPSPSPVPLSRSSFFLVTKAGRVGPTEFDYSPAWIRYSVLRSLQRLHTPYVDMVYLHDVEFVSPAEVLAAVRELRRLRDDEGGVVRYVGISGFPVGVLCSLAEMILAETGEPLDAVLSYGHFTVQNRRLGGLPPPPPPPAGEEEQPETPPPPPPEHGGLLPPLARFKKAGVDVVLNASILGMGLLTSRGIPVHPPAPGAAGDDGADKTPSLVAQWHPSPPGLRVACMKLAELAAAAGERLESVAIRWALAEWARLGAAAGLGVDVSAPGLGPRRVGATVCGVSTIAELEETVADWRGVLSSLGQVDGSNDDTYGLARQEKVVNLVQRDLWPALGSWLDHVWGSPGPEFVNTRRDCDRGVVPDDGVVAAYEMAKQARQTAQSTVGAR
ncbi:Aldo/keto reductase family-domain-containing protein [Chaetomidium leptoderma]|uniref:Aldo/keto reductase family-domain-containing protein n=1 Tax=Chaetomidium leptoderma TaxID=669021 RepID=A0AAN6VP60_9PEZI|nr:Aldo/keto reductase family-domain-containing protein [Chaetomidium leptoderma]